MTEKQRAGSLAMITVILMDEVTLSEKRIASVVEKNNDALDETSIIIFKMIEHGIERFLFFHVEGIKQ